MSVYDNAKQSLKSSSMKRESSYVPSKISSPQTTNYDFPTFTKFDDNTKENMANELAQLREEIQAIKANYRHILPLDYTEPSFEIRPTSNDITENMRATVEAGLFRHKIKKLMEAYIPTSNLLSTQEYLVWRSKADGFYKDFPDFIQMKHSGTQLINTLTGKAYKDATTWLHKQQLDSSCTWKALRKYLDDKYFVSHTPRLVSEKIMHFKLLGTPAQIQTKFYDQIDLYDDRITRFAIDSLQHKLPSFLIPFMYHKTYNTIQEFFDDLRSLCLTAITPEMYQMEQSTSIQQQNFYPSQHSSNYYKSTSRQILGNNQHNTSHPKFGKTLPYKQNSNNMQQSQRHNNNNKHYNSQSEPHQQKFTNTTNRSSNAKKGTTKFHHIAVKETPNQESHKYTEENIILSHVSCMPQQIPSSSAAYPQNIDLLPSSDIPPLKKTSHCYNSIQRKKPPDDTSTSKQVHMKFIECFPISSKIHIFSSSTCIQPQLYIPVLQYFPIKLGIDKHNWIDSIALIDSGSQINAVHSSIINKLKIATTELLEHKQLCYANNTHETITSYVPQLQFKLYDAHDSKIYYKNNITTVVTSSLPDSAKVLLGMNFILTHLVKINFWKGEVTTKEGQILKQLTPPHPIPLIKKPQRVKRQHELDINMNLQIDSDLKTDDDYKNFNEVIKDIPLPISKIIRGYKSCFPPQLPAGLPPLRNGYEHKIEFKDNIIIEKKRTPAFRYSLQQQQLLQEHIDKLLAKGFIQKSRSSYVSNALLVKKKDDEKGRMCIDYRWLNNLTKYIGYPLPRILDIIDRLYNAKVFSKLDLASGYHQIRVRQCDIEKTAFQTQDGLFEWLVMPFGLCGAPATFQYMMNDLLRECISKYVVVYLDDILIYSPNMELHAKHIEAVLSIFQKHKLYVKLSKCEFAKQEVVYLGYTIGQQCLRTEEKKIMAVKEFPIPPTNITNLKSFLGLTGYYRRFIQNYAGIAKPLYDVLQHQTATLWSNECQEAAEKLKAALISAPVLRLPDPHKPFIITTDASQYAIGGVLSQICDEDNQEHPIAYESKRLPVAYQRQPAFFTEFRAVVTCVHTWQVYLFKPFIIRTDHLPLRFMLTQDKLSGRLAFDITFLSQFTFTIEYKPGRINTVADALSRREDHEKAIKNAMQSVGNLSILALAAINTPTLTLQPTFAEAYQQAIQQDTKFLKIYKTPPRNHEIRNGYLYCITKSPIEERRLLILPSSTSLKEMIIKKYHSDLTASHLGSYKTADLISRYFKWNNLYRDVKEYVKRCEICIRNKSSTSVSQGLLHPLPIPQLRWATISIDFISGIPETKQSKQELTQLNNNNIVYNSVMVVVDKLSKYAIFIPTTTQVTALQVSKLYMQYVFAYFGMPSMIISDRDPKFLSDFWRSLMKTLAVTQMCSTAYHPQTDGQTERTNRALGQMLRCTIQQIKNNLQMSIAQDNEPLQEELTWVEMLPIIQFAYNNAVSEATGFSPFYLMYGMHPTIPSAITEKNFSKHISKNCYNLAANQLATSMADILKKATHNLKNAQKKQKYHADKHRKNISFSLYEFVMLATRFLRMKHKKLEQRYIGPYKIIKVISPVVYKLELPNNMRIHNVFHISQLKKYTGTRPHISTYLKHPITRIDDTTALVETNPGNNSIPNNNTNNIVAKDNDIDNDSYESFVEIEVVSDSDNNLQQQQSHTEDNKEMVEPLVSTPLAVETLTSMTITASDVNTKYIELIDSDPAIFHQSIKDIKACRLQFQKHPNSNRHIPILEYLVTTNSTDNTDTCWVNIDILKTVLKHQNKYDMLERFDENPIIKSPIDV